MVRNIVRDFLDGRHVNHRAVLPSHLGQAYVRFHHAYDRDNMVRLSPIPFGNIHISFTKHNEGRNWRRIFFNDECWMTLLGFSEDYKSERHIQNAISEFGRIILWEESDSFPGRLMVRARVISGHEVPQFLVYSDPLDVNGDSWTIQCEVMQYHPLGQGPPVEDPMPDELELENVVPFDFFGLGQPVIQQDQNDQQHEEDGQQGQEQQGNQEQDQPPMQQLNPWDPWPAWPAELPVQPMAQQVQQIQDLNVELDQMDIDHNEPAVINPLEVIINPANLPPMEFLELNDFIEEIEENIPQPII